MFSVIDKDFCTVTVQDQAKFKLSVLAVYLASSLMNDRSSGTGEFSVNPSGLIHTDGNLPQYDTDHSVQNERQISYKHLLHLPGAV